MTLLEIGRIARPHGLHGEVVVALSTDRTERLAPGARLATDGAAGGAGRELEVAASRPHLGRYLVRFVGVEDIAAAEALRGLVLFAEAISDPEAFFVHELIGAVVTDPDGRQLGTVTAVEANPASDLLVVDDRNYVPARFIVERRPGVLVVELPEGLLECELTMNAELREGRGPFRVAVFTIFPELIEGYLAAGIVGRAQRDRLVELTVHDLRDGAHDSRRSVDDAPFGGGAGMVLAPGPVFGAIEAVNPPRPLLLCSPRGRRFDQAYAEELAGVAGGFSLLCARYEGVDERVAEHLVDGEVSVGDYILAGGELAALVVLEATLRLVPGALGNECSLAEESFADGLLEYPQYTRPARFRGWEVPEVLRSGDHRAVARWRRAAALALTAERRPDLLVARGGLSEDEVRLLIAHGYRVSASEHVEATIPSPTADGPSTEEPAEP